MLRSFLNRQKLKQRSQRLQLRSERPKLRGKKIRNKKKSSKKLTLLRRFI